MAFLGDRAQSSHRGFFGFLFSTTLRFFQLVLGLAVVGLYGQYVNAARLQGKYADSNYVFAVVVGTIGAVSALILMIPFAKMWRAFPWDFIVFVLWTALFGLFGKMFIHENPEGDGGIQTMKNAVWVDLANMIIWFITFVYGLIMFFTEPGRSRFTGRARV